MTTGGLGCVGLWGEVGRANMLNDRGACRMIEVIREDSFLPLRVPTTDGASLLVLACLPAGRAALLLCPCPPPQVCDAH